MPLAAAEDRALICFGNEPSWSVDLTTPGTARVNIPGEDAVTYRGVSVRNEPLKQGVWRGSPAAGRDLVVFLRDGACSDQMSDTQHPVSASVSLPDLRFLVGCCRIPVAPAAAAATAVALEGPSWRLTGLPGKDKATLGSLPRPITARFERGRVAGFSGCNNFMGGYSLEGDRLRLDPLAGTMMACPEPAMSIENAFKAAFVGTLRYSITGEKLTLASQAGATLSFEKEPPPRLEGVTWEATGFNNNRDAVVSFQMGTRATFSFADGTVSGNAGCNNFHGPYTTERNHIKIGPLATTFRMCDETLMTQEKQFLAALESAVVWAIDGGMLDMHRADEQRALTAKAAK